MRKLTTVALAAATSSVLLLGAPAIAGGPDDPVGGETQLGTTAGIKYVSETLDVGSSGHFGAPYEAAWIACGSHTSPWKPTSGGARIKGSQTDNYLAAHRPMDLDNPFEQPDNETTDDWWDTTVHSILGRSLTGYAVCTQRALRYVLTDTPGATSSERTGSTSCPGNRRLVGGGSFIATTGSFINSSYPGRGNTWQARIFDTVGGAGGMQTYAVCRNAGGVKVYTARSRPIAAGAVRAVTVKCPGARHVIGGGGRISGAIAKAHLAASQPIDSKDARSVPDDGWRVIVSNDTGGPKRATAYAICVRRG